MLGLVGAGVSATFTDGATAAMNVHVGTFNINVSSAQGAVACTPGLPGQETGSACTITYNAAEIRSSVASSAPFAFTVTSTGTIPALIHVTATTPPAPFTDVLGAVADFTLTQGESHTFNAGLGWPELFNGDLGDSASITYTILATG
jgi:hypothetical protein